MGQQHDADRESRHDDGGRDADCGLVTEGGTATITEAGAPWTLVYDNESVASIYSNVEYRTATSTGDYDPTWTLGSSPDWAASAIAIAVPSSGTTITPGAGSLAVTGYAPTAQVSNTHDCDPGRQSDHHGAVCSATVTTPQPGPLNATPGRVFDLGNGHVGA